MKRRYFGIFNWHGQVFKIWRYASNERRAFWLMTRKVSQQVKYSHYHVRLYFNGGRDNFTIERKEEREDEKISN